MIQTFTFIFQKTDITWMLPCCQPDTWEDIYCHFGILQSKEQTSNLSDGVCKTVIKILIDDLFNDPLAAFHNIFIAFVWSFSQNSTSILAHNDKHVQKDVGICYLLLISILKYC